MDEFVARYWPLITGILSGFDRLVFRGSLLSLIRKGGMTGFLFVAGIRLLDFRRFALETTERLKEASLAEARRLGRPIVYVENPTASKEDLARKLLQENPVSEGLICVLSALEPCRTFEYHRSPDPKERGLRLRNGKCLHLYHYFLDPRFGFMNARIQTWFPFNVQVCMNGREWLARQLEMSRGSAFRKHDNAFTWFENPALAQRLMDRQLTINWPRALAGIARRLNPLHRRIFKRPPIDYYWSAYQTEWATDLMFRDPRALAEIYPTLVRHAMDHFKSPDVLRFLGRKAHGNFTGELTGSFKNRPEGVRVKHWASGNSIKMYDKAGSVLRVETTIARPNDFKVFRPRHDDPDGHLEWKPLRKGVADLHRRAEVSQRSNEAYLEALSTVDDTTPCSTIFDRVSRPVFDHDRRYRALRLGHSDDLALLEAVSRGELSISGFRNRDIRRLLDGDPFEPGSPEARRFAAKTGRRIRLLRAHGLVTRIPKTSRYRLTHRGQLLTAAISAVRNANIKELLQKAA